MEIIVPIDDRPWGLRDYSVKDLNGYRLTFGHHIFNTGPALEMSPHTKTDLRYIQGLKKKHGMDYDSHASYHFVERSHG